MLLFFLTFGISALATLLIVRSSHTHARFSADHDFGGPQKFHVRAVPRVGGIGIAIGLLGGVIALAAVRDPAEQRFAALLLLCGVPAFGSGLFEDVSKRVEPRYRLVATAISALPSPRAPREGWAVGMAVKRDADELGDALARSVAELVASGRMAQMFARGNVSWRAA